MTGKLRPVVAPALFVLLVMAACKIIYNLPLYKILPGAYRPVAFVAALLLNFSITFGPSLVYPLARKRGASVLPAVAAALLTTIVWNIWEIIRVTEYFSPAVSLYYGLNSMFLGAVVFGFFQMGVWEIILRLREKSTENQRRLLPPIAASFASLATVYLMLFWSMGAHWFYMYGNVYKAIFH